jgi:hypothetical protein
MKAIYVSSFNQKLYKASGEHLIKSFAEFQAEDLIIGYDGDESFSEGNAHFFNVERDRAFLKWLKTYPDKIPAAGGGRARNLSSWNNRSTDWYKKVVTVHRVYQECKNQYDKLIWLDCDCVIKKTLAYDLIDSISAGYDVVHLRGAGRIQNKQQSETGFLIYNLAENGGKFIEEYLSYYLSGRVFENKNWDDCTVFDSIQGFKKRDVATTISKFNGSTSNVIPNSPLGPYIEHYKGQHSRVLKIV